MANSAQSQQNFIGIDLCEPIMRAAIVSGDGEVVERREAPLDRENVVGQVVQMVTSLRDREANVTSVGVAIPGLVNRFTDRVLASTELPGTVREDLHAELMKATGLRFELENDANAAAYGEYQIGAGQSSR
ncbi:MAG: ROK family protein, partial [Acidobacteriota bacterium]|nr:ROK family protein [Acidobacteriota bacterium]